MTNLSPENRRTLERVGPEDDHAVAAYGFSRPHLNRLMNAVREESARNDGSEAAVSVEQYVAEYEFRGEADYKPKDHEQELIIDAIYGYLAVREESAPPIPAEVEVQAVDLETFVDHEPKSAVMTKRRQAAQSLRALAVRADKLEAHLRQSDAAFKQADDAAIAAEAQRDTLQAEVVRLRESGAVLLGSIDLVHEAQGRNVIDPHSLEDFRAALNQKEG